MSNKYTQPDWSDDARQIIDAKDGDIIEIDSEHCYRGGSGEDGDWIEMEFPPEIIEQTPMIAELLRLQKEDRRNQP